MMEALSKELGEKVAACKARYEASKRRSDIVSEELTQAARTAPSLDPTQFSALEQRAIDAYADTLRAHVRWILAQNELDTYIERSRSD